MTTTLGYEPELEAIVEAVVTHPKVARRVVKATTVDQAAGAAIIAAQTAQDTAQFAQDTADYALVVAEDAVPAPVDDGTPPAAPTGVVVETGMRALTVSWAVPPQGDHVVSSRVRLTRIATATVPEQVTVYAITGIAHTQIGLEQAQYRVEVWHVDMWGRVSTTTDAGLHQPEPAAADLINLEELAMNDRISGMLPNINLAPIGDPTKFVEGVIEGVALAAGQNANVLPWNECEWENWANGQAWPPPGILASVPAGHTATVMTIQDRKWLSHERTTSTANAIVPFANWTNYALNGSEWAIYSGYVRVAAGAPTVRVGMQKASDAVGTGVETVYGDPLVASMGTDHRIWVKFQRDPAKPFMRFLHLNSTDNTTVRWTRQQLEMVDPSDTEPGPYSVPAMTFGAMSGRLLAVMDAAILNAVIATGSIQTALIMDAAIDNAKIANLAVTTAKIADLNVTAAKIADLHVTNAKIANLAVTTAKIADLTVTTAKIDNLAVTSAKINDLSANKITAGTINTGTIAISSALRIGAGGSFALAGSVFIDETGLNLIGLTAEVENPNVNTGAKITPRASPSFSSLNFYQNSTTTNRGMSLVGAGDATYNGAVQMTALNAPGSDPNAASSGRILARSRVGTNLRGYMNLIGTEMLATRSWTGTMGANTVVAIGMANLRRGFRVHLQVSLPSSDNWTPCMEGTGHGIRMWWDTATSLRIANDTAGNRGIAMVFDDGGL